MGRENKVKFVIINNNVYILYCRSCLNDWVTGLGGYTTVVVVVLGHPDVAVLAPRGSPGVLDDPVLPVPGEDSALLAVPDDQHSVVEACGGAEQRLVHPCNS